MRQASCKKMKLQGLVQALITSQKMGIINLHLYLSRHLIIMLVGDSSKGREFSYSIDTLPQF